MNTHAPYPLIHGAALQTIERLLDHERLMSVATIRTDGWPQVTTVGYLNEGLNLYFVTGRESQKLINLQKDPRVSIAINSGTDVDGAVGVSMAGRATEVSEPNEVERLNRLMFARWPQVSVYCPATSSIAIVGLKPDLICLIRASAGRSQTECFSMDDVSSDEITSPGAVSAEARLF
ncbi:pyridoxamine 5'-phosphate oxidase family protein [Brevundimonas variabilis]|uniref:General stress protein 26 n=1 Tax=Brevundimonas variabilis TaxID=74312 RepID=A0A7W9CKV2_9CAUL|nr:pyridoxamine 5'-phosphate oxidase family protein [Brevundimonas variabilis]MBB5747560.1 general stress protein 26 [Brevundimonas variabilis]